jgi:hypothetical protein
MPVKLSYSRGRGGESRVQGQPRQKLLRPYLKNKIKTKQLGMTRAVEYLSSKALDSSPSTGGVKKKKRILQYHFRIFFCFRIKVLEGRNIKSQ